MCVYVSAMEPRCCPRHRRVLRFFCFRSAFNANSANNFNAFEFLGRSIENALKNVVQFNLAVVVAAVAVAVECFVGTVVTDRKG